MAESSGYATACGAYTGERVPGFDPAPGVAFPMTAVGSLNGPAGFPVSGV